MWYAEEIEITYHVFNIIVPVLALIVAAIGVYYVAQQINMFAGYNALVDQYTAIGATFDTKWTDLNDKFQNLLPTITVIVFYIMKE